MPHLLAYSLSHHFCDRWKRRCRCVCLFSVFLFALLSGCKSPNGPQVLGEAYVAPAILNLRSELAYESRTVAVLKHGDRLKIVGVRRRFYKVQTDNGIAGWVNSTQLISKEDIDSLKESMERYRHLPSQGKATAYDALNVHMDPSRQSLAFYQIPDGGSVDVIGHQIAPRITGAPSIGFVLKQPARTQPAKEQKKPKAVSLRPPKPPAPKPPANWVELSRERVSPKDGEPKKESEPKPELPPVPMEDWFLVRMKDQKIGWVLARMLQMSIPDEVAQYAEGGRITSYFDLGAVQDEDLVKHHWLWTTVSKTLPYDFDGIRVFIWNRRRHRYETAYRERNMVGVYPVSVDKAAAGTTNRTFALVIKDANGTLWKKVYVFDGMRAWSTGTQPYEPGRGAPEEQLDLPISSRPSWWQRRWQSVKRLFGGKSK